MAEIDFVKLNLSFKKVEKIKRRLRANSQTDADQHVIDDLAEEIYQHFRALSSTKLKSRLAAMHLAIVLDQTIWVDLMRQRSQSNTQVMQLVRVFEKLLPFRFECEMFLVYFKALNYAAHILGAQVMDFHLAMKFLKISENMYQYFLKREEDQPLYDVSELFSKTENLTPTKDGRQQVEDLFTNDLAMLSILHRNLNEMSAHIRTNHQILERQFGPSPLMWVVKVLKSVPALLQQGLFKQMGYYLTVASKVLQDHHHADEDEKKHIEEVRFRIAKCWIEYCLSLFDFSRTEALNSFHFDLAAGDGSDLPPECESVRNLTILDISRSGATRNKREESFSREIHRFKLEGLVDLESEITHSIQNTEEARQLFHHGLDMIQCILSTREVQADPISFITVHYQLSDLFHHRIFFEDSYDSQYKYQKNCLESFSQMMNDLSKTHPNDLQWMKPELLRDFNQMHIDLLQSNCHRLFASKPAGGIQKQMNQKLTELRDLNKSLAYAMVKGVSPH